MLSCAPPPEKLPDLFEDSSRALAVPGSWQANRRYYLLADFFNRQGFARCLPYRPTGDCTNYPRMEQQSFVFSEQKSRQLASRINYGKNLILEPNSHPQDTYLFDYTGIEPGRLAAVSAREFLECLAQDPQYLNYMPRVVFAEGAEGLGEAQKLFPAAKRLVIIKKKCFLPDKKI